MTNAEEIANEFLEVASEQRVSMLLNLAKERHTLSGMVVKIQMNASSQVLDNSSRKHHNMDK